MRTDRKASELRRRSADETERELAVDELGDEELPGGAEGGDESPAANRPGGVPAKDQSPLGDTDQHSDPRRLPRVRRRANDQDQADDDQADR